MFKQMTRLTILLATAGLAVGVSGGYLGFLHPFFDTLSNFRLHFAVLLIVSAVVSVFIFRSKLILGFGIAALFSLIFQPQFERPDTNSPGRYKALNLNLYYSNPTPEKVRQLIKDVDADILLFSEYSQLWQDRLQFLKTLYPHTHHCPEWSIIGGSMTFSKFPLSQVNQYCHSYAALSLDEVLIEGRKLTLGNVHLRWPWPASGPRQVNALQTKLEQIGKSALITGDFNSTTWTQLVRRFAKFGDLKILGGTGPTWMYRRLPTSWAKFAGLTLDNTMIKGNVEVKTLKTLAPVGSDHLPILIEFSLK